MKTHRIASVEALHHPTLCVTFDDGIGGILDLSEAVTDRAMFAPLNDESFFRTVALGDEGRTFGGNFDVLGQEIDLCPDATRIRIKTQIAEHLASGFEATRFAAA